jgi:hypothetical protein
MSLEDEACDTKENDQDRKDGNDPRDVARCRILQYHPQRSPPPCHPRLAELYLIRVKFLFSWNLVVWVVYAVKVQLLSPAARDKHRNMRELSERYRIILIHYHPNS